MARASYVTPNMLCVTLTGPELLVCSPAIAGRQCQLTLPAARQRISANQGRVADHDTSPSVRLLAPGRTEINGFVASMIDGEQVARSRGMSFLNLAPGESASNLFEAPNAPCDEATEYVFIVGACRFDASFSPQEDCAARIVGVAPVAEEATTP